MTAKNTERHPAPELAERGFERLHHQGAEELDMRGDELPGDDADHGGDAGELGGVDQLLFGEQAADASEGVESVEVGRDGLGAQRPAARCDHCRHGDGQHQQAQRQVEHETLSKAVHKALQRQFWLLQGLVVKRELAAQAGAQFFEAHGSKGQQHQRTAAEHGEVGQVLGSRNLAVVAGLFQALRGGG
jgi:hypothetical protein